MSSSTEIGIWATGVWLDLGSPANISALTLSGYAIAPSTLGRLNNFIGACYSGSGWAGPGSVNYDVVPDLTDPELAIINAMYLVSYYNGLSQATMGAGGSTIPWQSLKEGDSTITRASAPAIGKTYADMAKDAMANLKYLVNVYINNSQGGNTPRSVNYLDIWTPEVGGGWGGYGR